MNMGQKGFANIILVVAVVILVGAVSYFAFVKKSEPIAQQPTPASTQTKTPTPPTPTPKDETANWKIYVNTQYGFSFKYPDVLNVVPDDITGSPKGVVAKFSVYDAKYIAPPDAVGMDVRDELRNVHLTIYRYSDVLLQSLQKQIDQTIKDQNNKPDVPKHTEFIINSDLNIKGYVLWSGLIGPYFESLFHDGNYIFEAQTESGNFTDLAKQILSTFKFTN